MKVKVWNDNVHPYIEEFKGTKYKIPALKYILMDADEANLFRGSFNSPKMDGDGKQTADSFKMIRIEVLPDGAGEAEHAPITHSCNVCMIEVDTPEELIEHSKKEHAHLMIQDDEAETDLKSRKRGKSGEQRL